MKKDLIEFQIVSGSGLRSIAKTINEAGIEIDPRLFTLLGKLQRVDTKIQAGSYEVHSGINALDLLNKITQGDVTQAGIVFIEGWTFKQMREKLDSHPDLKHDTKGLSDAEIMTKLGASGDFPEGFFFPDTYLFAKQSSDMDVLSRAYRIMQDNLKREWEKESK